MEQRIPLSIPNIHWDMGEKKDKKPVLTKPTTHRNKIKWSVETKINAPKLHKRTASNLIRYIEYCECDGETNEVWRTYIPLRSVTRLCLKPLEAMLKFVNRQNAICPSHRHHHETHPNVTCVQCTRFKLNATKTYSETQVIALMKQHQDTTIHAQHHMIYPTKSISKRCLAEWCRYLQTACKRNPYDLTIFDKLRQNGIRKLF